MQLSLEINLSQGAIRSARQILNSIAVHIHLNSAF